VIFGIVLVVNIADIALTDGVFLGVSRIPHHRVGSHRRVTFRDLLVYQKARDIDRRKALGGLLQRLKEEGYYETDYTGDAG
jgi:hypothetical protein